MDAALPNRLRVTHRLGSGGMGVVYAGQDEQGRPIAIKTLQYADPDDIYKLKREFRALADLTHENLVALHALESEGRQVWFTMERVDGRPFVDHVRRRLVRRQLAGSTDNQLDAIELDALRGLIRQLARGLGALHAAGRVHRDIKPSNVLVTRQGQVKILDFGVTTLIGPRGMDLAAAQRVVGTVAYMAPEQGWGMAVGPAADAYAMGVMVYEALSGQRPFQGALVNVIAAKDARRYPPLDPSLPADLLALVEALLDPDPAARPDAEGVFALLNGQRPAARAPIGPAPSWPLVGRGAELDRLSAALDRARTGPVLLRIHGPAGVGKTALIERFVDTTARLGRGLVFSARCAPEERIPYPALDGLIDGISRHLIELPDAERAAALPEEAALLARLFPVLNAVPDLPWTEPGARPLASPASIRRRVVRGLGALIRKLGAALPVVAWLDEVQWADDDSALILRDLLQSEPAPPLLLICSGWPAQGTPEPLRQEGSRVERIDLGPLSAEAIGDLLRQTGGDPARAAALFAETQGDPLLLGELLRSGAGSASEGLGALLLARVAARSPTEQRLIALLAVAGRPLPAPLALEAADAGEEGPDLLRRLLRANLLGRTRIGGGVEVGLYHPRIRDEVCATTAPALQEALRARLLAVARMPLPGSEGLTATAELDAAITAAEQAFAYHLAARLGLLRSLPPGSPTWERLDRRAKALSLVGRAAEAAQTWEEAAQALSIEVVGDDRVRGLRRQAAEHWLRCGRLDEGLASLDSVLQSVGLSLPGSSAWALLTLGFLRVRLYTRWRGLRPQARIGPADKALVLRIDTCWTAAMGLIWVDAFRSAVFQCRFTLLALEYGEPERVAMALATEAAFCANEGGAANRRRSAEALAAAEATVGCLQAPVVLAITRICRSAAAFFSARFGEAAAAADEAIEVLRVHAPGRAWERTNADIFGLWSLALMGDLAALRARLLPVLADAQEQGNLLAAASLSSGLSSVLWLAEGRPEEARRLADEAMAIWPSGGSFQTQHYMDLVARVGIALYEGRGAELLGRLEEALPRMKAAQMLRLQFIRMDTTYLHGRLCLAAARARPAEAARHRKAAEADARRLAAEDLAWGKPLAAALRAGLEIERGGAPEPHLQAAAAGFAAQDMALHALSARLLRGEATAREALLARGVVDPDRLARVLIPA